MKNFLKLEAERLKKKRLALKWEQLSELQKYNSSYSSLVFETEEKNISVGNINNSYEPSRVIKETGGEGYQNVVSTFNRIQSDYGNDALRGSGGKDCIDRYTEHYIQTAALGLAGVGTLALWHFVYDPRGKGGFRKLQGLMKFLSDAYRDLRGRGLGRATANFELDQLLKQGFRYFQGTWKQGFKPAKGAPFQWPKRFAGALTSGAFGVGTVLMAIAVVTDFDSVEEFMTEPNFIPGEVVSEESRRVLFDFFRGLGLVSQVDLAIKSELLNWFDLGAEGADAAQPLADGCRWLPVLTPLLIAGVFRTVGHIGKFGPGSAFSKFESKFLWQNGFRMSLRKIGKDVIAQVGSSGRLYHSYWRNVLDDILEAGGEMGEAWFKQYYPSLGTYEARELRELIIDFWQESANSARTLGDEVLSKVDGGDLQTIIRDNRRNLKEMRKEINDKVDALIKAGEINADDYLRLLDDMSTFDGEAILYSMEKIRGGGRFASLPKRAFQSMADMLTATKEKLFNQLIRQYIWPALSKSAAYGASKIKAVGDTMAGGAKFIFSSGDDVKHQLDNMPRMRINLLDDAASSGPGATSSKPVPLSPGRVLEDDLVRISKASQKYEMETLFMLTKDISELSHLEAARKALMDLGTLLKEKMAGRMAEIDEVRELTAKIIDGGDVVRVIKVGGDDIQEALKEKLIIEIINFFRASQGSSKQFIRKLMDDLYDKYDALRRAGEAVGDFDEWLNQYLILQSKLPKTKQGIHSLLARLLANYTNPILITGRPGRRLGAVDYGAIEDALQGTIDGLEDAAEDFFQATQMSATKKTALGIAGLGTAAITGYLLIGLPQREIEESTIFESEGHIVFNDNIVGRTVAKFINSLEGKSYLCQIIDSLLATPVGKTVWTGQANFPKEQERAVKNILYKTLIETGAYWETAADAERELQDTLVKEIEKIIKATKASTDFESERRKQISQEFNKMQAKNGQAKYNYAENLVTSIENYGYNEGNPNDALISPQDRVMVILTALLTKGTNVIERLCQIAQNEEDMRGEIYQAWVYQEGDTDDFIETLQKQLSNPNLDCEGVRNWYTNKKQKKSDGAMTDEEKKEMEKSKKLKSQGGKRYIGGKDPKTTNENKKNDQLSDLEKLVRESLKESYNMYPYHSEVGADGEEIEDFLQDWKDLCMNVNRDESRNTAIEIAKILVKDLELFDDVLELVGSNQSTGAAILRKMSKK